MLSYLIVNGVIEDVASDIKFLRLLILDKVSNCTSSLCCTQMDCYVKELSVVFPTGVSVCKLDFKVLQGARIAMPSHVRRPIGSYTVASPANGVKFVEMLCLLIDAVVENSFYFFKGGRVCWTKRAVLLRRYEEAAFELRLLRKPKWASREDVWGCRSTNTSLPWLKEERFATTFM